MDDHIIFLRHSDMVASQPPNAPWLKHIWLHFKYGHIILEKTPYLFDGFKSKSFFSCPLLIHKIENLDGRCVEIPPYATIVVAIVLYMVVPKPHIQLL